MLRLALVVAASGFAVAAHMQAHAQDATRAIEHVAGDVYRFQNNFHYALVVETDVGVVVSDSINLDAARWLRAEIEERFGKPVTHLIMSHSHADHASGGETFADTAEIIAHANFSKSDNPLEPTITFEDDLLFESGGKTFELQYLGPGHGDDLIVTIVRPENVAFVVDAVSPKRLPYRDFGTTDIDGLIEQIRTIESLDFEILAPGHSILGSKQDATDARLYVEELKAAVEAGLGDGKTVDELVETIDLTAYADWAAYDDFRDLNIRGMAAWLEAQGG